MRDVLAAVVRLDLGEVLRSRWILLCLAVYALLAGLFLFVGLRESMVLGFTGLGRVIFSLCHALVLVLPLLGLIGAGPAIARSREEGSLEFWLSQPVGRGTWLAGVTLVRYAALLLPLVAVLLVLVLWVRFALGEALPWAALFQALALCAALLWAFVALGIATSVASRSVARATTLLLLFWALSVALVDFALIGVLLQWRLPPQAVFALAALNPVQSTRAALVSLAEPELAVMGPVGFYLANELGTATLRWLGLLWPIVFGAFAWAFAFRTFRSRDLV